MSDSTRIIRRDARVAELEEALLDTVRQFAVEGERNGRAVLHTGGLSALEMAFAALGWSDPCPAPESECEIDGRHKFATCGTLTQDGYKCVCGEHFHMLRAQK